MSAESDAELIERAKREVSTVVGWAVLRDAIRAGSNHDGWERISPEEARAIKTALEDALQALSASRLAELQAKLLAVREERDALLQRPLDLAKLDSIDDEEGVPDKMVSYYWWQQTQEARAERTRLHLLVEESLFHLRLDARAEAYHHRALAALSASPIAPEETAK